MGCPDVLDQCDLPDLEGLQRITGHIPVLGLTDHPDLGINPGLHFAVAQFLGRFFIYGNLFDEKAPMTIDGLLAESFPRVILNPNLGFLANVFIRKVRPEEVVPAIRRGNTANFSGGG